MQVRVKGGVSSAQKKCAKLVSPSENGTFVLNKKALSFYLVKLTSHSTIDAAQIDVMHFFFPSYPFTGISYSTAKVLDIYATFLNPFFSECVIICLSGHKQMKKQESSKKNQDSFCL